MSRISEDRTIVVESTREGTATRRKSRFAERDRILWDRILGAALDLRAHGMPPMEVHTLLVTDDPVIVRRHMDLHRERLEEQFLSERVMVGRIENVLMEAARRRSGSPSTSEVERGGAAMRTCGCSG